MQPVSVWSSRKTLRNYVDSKVQCLTEGQRIWFACMWVGWAGLAVGLRDSLLAISKTRVPSAFHRQHQKLPVRPRPVAAFQSKLFLALFLKHKHCFIPLLAAKPCLSNLNCWQFMSRLWGRDWKLFCHDWSFCLYIYDIYITNFICKLGLYIGLRFSFNWSHV